MIQCDDFKKAQLYKEYRRHGWMSINATRRIHCNIWMWWSTIRRHKLLQIKISLMNQRKIKIELK